MNEIKAASDIAKLLADPLRLSILQFLTWGPCSVANLVEASGASQPNVSNHLKLLREGQAVIAEKQGRQTFYRVASPDIAEVIAALSWAATRTDMTTGQMTPTVLQEGRACYDHLAGRIGVNLMSGLVATSAITPPSAPWDAIQLGPAATQVFTRLGLDLRPTHSDNSRRRFAFSCPDWSEQCQSHLGGVLGAAICQHCQEQGWIERDAISRAMTVTDKGRNALDWLFDA